MPAEAVTVAAAEVAADAAAEVAAEPEEAALCLTKSKRPIVRERLYYVRRATEGRGVRLRALLDGGLGCRIEEEIGVISRILSLN